MSGVCCQELGPRVWSDLARLLALSLALTRLFADRCTCVVRRPPQTCSRRRHWLLETLVLDPWWPPSLQRAVKRMLTK
jgi:hypothetical protein